ncbi:non-ribosomal peptide synthetase [Dactylosporangium matsuzakiense]|uniref:non-ribosomal peptide synthetase n=1 Tax=Dactylosporangium matsuzakiense TaxID=53360 RepID=UPI00220A38F5|nr:non-ribosomal peptide synthetase [Dactylosporangium matsuzakiense]UWZ41228.1 non-ribosomal peptide synthetase [Dactylosporangium matsuzakiense]
MSVDVPDGTIRKPVSASDRWWLAHPASVAPVIQAVVEGTGTITPAALRDAVAAAAAACPDTALTGTRRHWLTGGAPPRVRTVKGAAGGPGTVAAIDALHEPLPAPDGAFCEVLWCPGEPAAVVFRANHAVMDWPGMALWIADVFRVLRGEAPLGAADPITEDDVFARFAAPAEKPPAPKIDWVSPLGQPSGERRTAWARRTVDGYHAGLVAKVAGALTTAYGLDTARFAVAFDMRRHVPGVRTTGNLSQVELFDTAAGEPWEALHERILTAMAEGREVSGRIDSGLLKLPRPVLRTLIKVMENGAAAKRRYASATVLAHLGRIEPADLCGPAFEARTLYPIPLLTAASPPDLNLVECGGRTELTLTWRDGEGAAERMGEVLDAVAEALSPAALRTWAPNATARELPAATVVDRFRARAAATPDAEAVRWPDGRLTYAELDARSDAVAARLRDLGVRPGSVVGLLAGRSPHAIAGIWGVLKAGAAYLPLDVQHPDGRLAGLLADAGAQVCLVEQAYAQRAAVGPQYVRVVLDEVGTGHTNAAVVSVAPADLAYVIYTSGSTGKPKGVEIEHAALANYVDWTAERFGVGPGTAFAVFTSLAFDLSNTALFTPLCVGGTLVLEPGEPSHVTMRRLVETSGADTISLTPSHLDLMGRLDLHPAGVRTLVVVGEQLRGPVAARAQEQFGPDCRILNMYGPTEATVGLTLHTYEPADGAAPAVSIGVPMDNCTVHLLDQQRRFVPAGEPGEMYLGGAQLARGYRGRRDLTRERFVHLADGTRVYRTGDLARVGPGGELEFIGRADDQVKVNGYRIEPAEIAQVLQSHPAVAGAVVVARARPGAEQKQLVGYVVLEAGAEPADWDAFLGGHLPRYMVPAATLVVDTIPHNANGKVDVAALPDPFAAGADTPGAGAGGDLVPEQDEVVSAVAGVWARTLGVEGGRLDRSADFHQLGGNSVQLLTMLAAVSHDVVGAGAEAAFMAQLGAIIREPTLARVSELARSARDGHQPTARDGHQPTVRDGQQPTADGRQPAATAAG